MIFVLLMLSDSMSLRSNTRQEVRCRKAEGSAAHCTLPALLEAKCLPEYTGEMLQALQNLLLAPQGQVSSLRLRKWGCASKGMGWKEETKQNKKKGTVVLQGPQKTYFPTGRDELVDFTASTHNFIAT